MYEAFYGLKEKPFDLTPDPRFLYLSEKHKEAFAHLLYGIKNRMGFVMISGEIGTGKTTICRTLLDRLDENTEVAFILNPSLSCEELLRKINEDFGMATRAQSVKGLVDELNAYLLERHGQGKNCVLVIDEAQNLKPEVLEQVRLLSNLETNTQKLLQIVLVGQPELAANLALPELRQLNQRITARYHLKPLSRRETLQYIGYRLRVAGGRRKVRFSPRAVKRIYRASGGTPRVINALCDRALLIGYTLETREITAPMVRRAVREIRGEPIRTQKAALLRHYLPSPTLLAVAVLVVLLGKYVAAPFAEQLSFWVPATPVSETRMIARARPHSVQTPEQTPRTQIAPASTESAAEASGPLLPSESRLALIIDGMSPAAARNAAALGILRAWNTALISSYPLDDSVESLAAFGKDNGLTCVMLQQTTLEQIENIDLPMFARVTGDTQIVWLGVVGLSEEAVHIATGIGETEILPKEEFEKRFLNQAVILWRDPRPGSPTLRGGDRGEEVEKLQEQLKGLGFLDATPTGVYDPETERAVKQLQAAAGLREDGIVGPQTRMVLAGRLPEPNVPSLQIDASPEIPSKTSVARVESAADITTHGAPARETMESGDKAGAAVVAVAEPGEASPTGSEEGPPASDKADLSTSSLSDGERPAPASADSPLSQDNAVEPAYVRSSLIPFSFAFENEMEPRPQ